MLGSCVDQGDHSCERVASGLVDDGKEYALRGATYEKFCLVQDRVESREVEGEPAVEIGIGFQFIRVVSSVKGRDKRCQFDTVGFEGGLVEGHDPVDVVWVWAIVLGWERRVVAFERIRERHGVQEIEEEMGTRLDLGIG
jgi:hypothetical protein